MALQFLGKNPDSPDGDSPTIYLDRTTDSYIVQGWKVTDPERLAQLSLPEHETVIELPRRMVQFFLEVNGGGANH
ncbi:hypothetical protein [Dactylosporangium sp. NPDC051541]|uniref:hypothetical protein n=1 Tax=Dactylosporangium sp. NPDC051541 TaxID=3363977 RepID=UPI003790674F